MTGDDILSGLQPIAADDLGDPVHVTRAIVIYEVEDMADDPYLGVLQCGDMTLGDVERMCGAAIQTVAGDDDAD